MPPPSRRPGWGARATVLVVDDEADVVDLVRLWLGRAGKSVLVAEDGLRALALARAQRPNLIVLDLMLPQMSGQEVCRQLRADPETSAIPIIMLTARGETQQRIAGLEIGADDYLTKPFSPRELLLRIEALLRRAQPTDRQREAIVETGDFRIDKGSFRVSVAGRPVELTTTEFKLLTMLIERRGRTLSRDTLLREVWGYHTALDTRTVDTHVRRLRAKLGAPHAAHLETGRGDGYRFTAVPHDPTQSRG